MNQTEKRCYDGQEFRAVTDDESEKIIEGHAAVFDSSTCIGGRFMEVITRDAFNGCDLSDVSLLVNHDSSGLPLARTKSGTLQLSVDNIGLHIRAQLDVDNSPSAKDLFSAVKRRDIDGMSFAFCIADDDWQNLNSDMPTRTIRRIGKVYDVSAVNLPAYSTTDIHARAAEILAEARKEVDTMTFEQFENYMAQHEAKKKADEEESERTRAIRLHDERKAAEAKQKRKALDYIPGKGFIPAEDGRNKSLDSALELREKAGNDLKENRSVKSPLSVFGELRAVTITPAQGQSATIVVPNHYGTEINPTFNVVSSLIDGVAHLSVQGGESFRQAYISSIDAGNYTAEGANAANAETHFNYADINKTKVTAYAELTEELFKLPSAIYADTIFQNIRTSMRKLLSKEIMVGAGGTNQLVGIFDDGATAIDANTDISIADITDTTLDQIIYKYGGDEDVEDNAVLILNKTDLLAFAKVRTSTKQKFYDIQLNGNGGSINGIPFIINSACKAITATSGTSTGDYCMAYGSLSGYTLVEFSEMDVKRSDDFKFQQGMTAYRGSCFFGGNVTRKNAFLRIKKAAS